jgi:hypothetical protein
VNTIDQFTLVLKTQGLQTGSVFPFRKWNYYYLNGQIDELQLLIMQYLQKRSTNYLLVPPIKPVLSRVEVLPTAILLLLNTALWGFTPIIKYALDYTNPSSFLSLPSRYYNFLPIFLFTKPGIIKVDIKRHLTSPFGTPQLYYPFMVLWPPLSSFYSRIHQSHLCYSRWFVYLREKYHQKNGLELIALTGTLLIVMEPILLGQKLGQFLFRAIS